MKKMTLIYVQKENQTLFLLRNQKTKVDISKNKYLGLGGKVDPNDINFEEAAKREMNEESGLIPNVLELLGTVSITGQTEYDVLIKVYTCSDFTGKIKESKTREGELIWIDNNEISNLNVWEGDKTFLPSLISKEKFDISLEYSDKKLSKVTKKGNKSWFIFVIGI